MKIEGAPFATIDWSAVPSTRHEGESGFALWRTVEAGNLRIRMVEYSAGYRADHWCERGHVVHVLSGELVTETRGAGTHKLGPGGTYRVADGAEPHRSSTASGALLLIVD